MNLATALVFFSLASMLLLLHAGFGVTRLLAFPAIRRDELLLMPFVGLAVIVSAGYWCGWMGWSAATTLWLVVILPAGINLVAILRPRFPLEVKPHLAAFTLAAGVFVVAAVPAGRSGALGPIGASGDQVLYTNVATYLEQNGLPAPPASDTKPATVQLGYINWGLPLGFSHLQAVVDRLVKWKAHQTVSLMTALLTAINVLAYPLLAGCLFRFGARGRLIVTALAAASPMLMGVHYGNYGMHVASLGLVSLAFGVAVLSLEDRSWRAAVLAAILLAAVFTTYPLGAGAFAFAPLALYVLLGSEGNWGRLRAASGRLARIAAIAILLALPGVVHVTRLLPLMLSFVWVKEFGNVDDHVSWTAAYGLSHHLVATPSFPAGLVPSWPAVIGIAVLLVTLYGVWTRSGRARLALLALVVTYVPFILWLRFGHDYPYGFFKALTFAVFPALIGLAAGAEALLERRRPAAIAATCAVVLSLLVTNLSALALLFRVVAVPDLSAVLALASAPSVERGATVHVRDDRDTDLLWVTYVLKDHALALAHESPYYLTRDWRFYQKAISANLVLVRRDTPLTESWSAGPRYQNSRYELLRKDPAILVHLDFWEAPRVLAKGRTLTVSVLPDAIRVDETSFPLRTPLPERPLVLRLGAFVPAGSVVRIDAPGEPETSRAALDSLVIERPIREVPARLSLSCQSDRTVLLPGWIQLVESGALPRVTEGVLDLFRVEALPGSGFFIVDGWHDTEPGLRWTQDRALAVFRTPPGPATLAVEGWLPGGAGTTAWLVLNGHQLGQIDQPGVFRRSFALPSVIRGISTWSELQVSVSRVFNPKRLGLAADARDLGVALTKLEVTVEGASTAPSKPGSLY